MLPIRITLDLGSVQAEVERLELALNQQVAQALRAITGRVAEEARNTHPYQNRTGLLESQTRPGALTGTFLNGDLEALVLGDTPYGEFLEERPEYAFLQPALDRVMPETDAILQQGVDEAARLAGWT